MDNHRLLQQLIKELIQQIEEYKRRRIEAQQETEAIKRETMAIKRETMAIKRDTMAIKRETMAIKRQAGSEYVPRRSSDEDCVICTLGLANVPLQDMVWCKPTCGHNFHRECLDHWRAIGAGYCPFWYALRISFLDCILCLLSL